MRVLYLSVENGVVLGVPFTPVIHNGCWVGEAEITDSALLVRMAGMAQFTLEYPGLVPVVTPAVALPVVSTPAPLEPAVVVTIGALPEDLPGRSYLLRADIDSVEDVKAMTDEQLIAVEGIGPKTLKDIREYLAR